MMHVLLFDIDGTLLHTGGAGSAALLGAFREVFAVPNPGQVPFAGRTDRWIVGSLFRLHGIADSEPHWERVRNEYLRRLEIELPRYEGRVLPGVQSLLTRLAAREDVVLGLLTGNTQRSAELKLKHYRLDAFFQFGGFGDRQHDRNGVAAEAIAAARAHVNGDFDPAHVWVVGDTPLDVSCARSVNARAVAVATGWHPRPELEAAKPDLLLDSLAGAEPLLALLD